MCSDFHKETERAGVVMKTTVYAVTEMNWEEKEGSVDLFTKKKTAEDKADELRQASLKQWGDRPAFASHYYVRRATLNKS